MRQLTYDARIGIIGAGISGVTAAYELKKKGYRNVTILEKSDHVGGKCHSIEYRGKTYEMGTLIGLPTYKHTLELMQEFDCTEVGPLLERGFFDRDGHKIAQIPMNQVPGFIEEFKRLPDIMSRYERLKEPGFLHLSEDLCQPFASWCEENELVVMKQVYMHYFSTFGFGCIQDVPAAYVLKFLNYDNLMSFIEITHMITWPRGSRELIKRMADRVDDLRLTCEVLRIEPTANGCVQVETSQGVIDFDAVIYTAPMHNFPKLVPLPPSDQHWFKQIKYQRFRVYAYRVEGLPEVSGYIPSNMSSERKGHMMAWYDRWADQGNSELVTVYVLEHEHMSDQQMREAVEQKLSKLGGRQIQLYMMKRWEHCPHVNEEALRAGFYEQLESMQGRDQIYLAGEIMNFPTLEHGIIYAKHLVSRFF